MCFSNNLWLRRGRLAKTAGAEPAGQIRDKKLHAVVTRITFPNQNTQNTQAPDNFWQLKCRKSARRCGAKYISKSKCIKHRFWQLRCRKSIRRYGAKHISKSKYTKHTSSGPLLEVQMSKKCMPLWRKIHFQVKMLKTPGFRTIFGGSNVASLRYTSLHYTPQHYTPLHYITQHYNYTTTLHYTTLHYTTLHYTTLH